MNDSHYGKNKKKSRKELPKVVKTEHTIPPYRLEIGNKHTLGSYPVHHLYNCKIIPPVQPANTREWGKLVLLCYNEAKLE
ncbi:hypothetical protein JOC77_003925 [Peribacillus deserti]|uniref:Uncharacterized protein n=1 Tax=Peribacillus deserti TaxID=673318 RepID=A0ABS2QMR1_9BACI|nr:hypothetical protein [Peribacillus deserti]MBM7694464.1 hypothetical protein [Peribacillus deserti]